MLGKARTLVLAGVLVAVACGGTDAAPPGADGGRDAPATDVGVADSVIADGASNDVRVPTDVGRDAFTTNDATADAPDRPCNGPPGLYVPGSCSTLAAGIMRFAPQYTLWSDGAAKERFLRLPPGTQIDTTDPNRWIFPVGTKAYKTFARDGKRLETRIYEKAREDVGLAAWDPSIWVWNEAQDAVTETTAGVMNALGTTHDVPPRVMCRRCHTGSTTDALLGVNAIQLNHAATAEAPTTLMYLQMSNLLTSPIDETRARIPGDTVTTAAVGYLYANCSNCHGGTSPEAGFNMFVPIGVTSVTALPVYTTGVGVASAFTRPGITQRISPMHPEDSALIFRMNSRDVSEQMPPVATELPDTVGIAAVSAWILSLR